MTRPVPNLKSAIAKVRDQAGKYIGDAFLMPPWNSFFQQLVQAAPAVADIVPVGSPFSYTANANGTLIISGGTVSAITLIRGIMFISLSTVRPIIIPISIGDTVQVIYTVAPTLQFLGA